MQSLALDVKVLNEAGEEVSLKSLTDDDVEMHPVTRERDHYEEVQIDDMFTAKEVEEETEFESEEDDLASIFDDMDRFDDDEKFSFKSGDLFDDDYDDMDD
ncbi:MAG: hypothetical protein IKT32_01560, partial [Clostridia bacterium]|nr:hypothetical protein [Clostridia bacterium]